MSNCLTCQFCKKKEKRRGTIYFCNEKGMMAIKSLLPTKCDRYKEKRDEDDN
jgi:hypothetical protein